MWYEKPLPIKNRTSFSNPRVSGTRRFASRADAASQVVIRGKIILGIAGDIIEYDMAALELGLNLALSPAASFAFLDKVRAKAVLI